MNLTNHEETPLHVVFAAVQREAEARGVEVAGTEIVGLVPEQALIETAQQALRLDQFDGRQVLESRLDSAESREAIGRLAASQPVKEQSPSAREIRGARREDAGASGADRRQCGRPSAAFAAGLGMMVAKLTRARAIETRLSEIRTRLHELAQADRDAYARVLQARKLPLTHPDRRAPTLIEFAGGDRNAVGNCEAVLRTHSARCGASWRTRNRSFSLILKMGIQSCRCSHRWMPRNGRGEHESSTKSAAYCIDSRAILRCGTNACGCEIAMLHSALRFVAPKHVEYPETSLKESRR